MFSGTIRNEKVYRLYGSKWTSSSCRKKKHLKLENNNRKYISSTFRKITASSQARWKKYNTLTCFIENKLHFVYETWIMSKFSRITLSLKQVILLSTEKKQQKKESLQ